jgi:4-hydroxythreonine-4-phosphate dehydrogenase
MPTFIIMLTNKDVTIPDCLDAYDEIRAADVEWVGFKDKNAEEGTLRVLIDAIHDDGRKAVLEVVSETAQEELRSLAMARSLGVDMVMGGTNVDQALPVLAGSGLLYYPFPGQVVDHPSVLAGSLEHIVGSARDLSMLDGVHGLDLLAYRWNGGEVADLIAKVVAVSDAPVVVAGSIADVSQIATVSSAGAWAFTVGSALFERRFVPGGSLRAQVDAVSAAANGRDS